MPQSIQRTFASGRNAHPRPLGGLALPDRAALEPEALDAGVVHDGGRLAVHQAGHRLLGVAAKSEV